MQQAYKLIQAELPKVAQKYHSQDQLMEKKEKRTRNFLKIPKPNPKTKNVKRNQTNPEVKNNETGNFVFKKQSLTSLNWYNFLVLLPRPVSCCQTVGINLTGCFSHRKHFQFENTKLRTFGQYKATCTAVIWIKLHE